MAFPVSTKNAEPKKFIPNEHRPRMLKDFLGENSNSCSSSGFKSFPRAITLGSSLIARNSTSKVLKSIPLPKSLSHSTPQPSSKSAAFRAIVNAMKSISLARLKVKPPLTLLPRSLSRKLSRKERKSSDQIKITVKIKDIIRWKSFRDLMDEQPPPSNFATTHRCTPASTATGPTSSASSSSCPSNGSSWSDSDFTSEYLPPSSGNSGDVTSDDVVHAVKFLPAVGKQMGVGPKDVLQWQEEEDEQQSPFSVLDFERAQDEEPLSPAFDPSIAQVGRKRQIIMQKITGYESLARLEPLDLDEWLPMSDNFCADQDKEEFKEQEHDTDGEEIWVEKKARELLYHVEVSESLQHWSFRGNVNGLLLDFFREELIVGSWRNQNGRIDDSDRFQSEILGIAKAWIDEGQQDGSFEYGIEARRDVYIRDMDRRGGWSKFEEEKHELGLEIETPLLDNMIDEILDEFF